MKMRFHSHGNEFDLHVNEVSFSYERMSTKTRFGKEAKDNSEMAYYADTTLFLGAPVRQDQTSTSY